MIDNDDAQALTDLHYWIGLVQTYLRAERMARGLGLTLDELKEAVRSTSILIQCGYTPDDIEAVARMHQRGESSTVTRFGTDETRTENER